MSRPGRHLLGAIALSLALACVASARTSQGPRLVGKFAIAGTVTVAHDIPGERAGSHFLRTWTFIAPCPTGTCNAATLVRGRANGSDRISLRRRTPGYYVGRGRFYAPARCGGRTYTKGVLVPFTIAVRVTAGRITAGVLVATRVRASYADTGRVNLTPCVAALGHDAATYHGHAVA